MVEEAGKASGIEKFNGTDFGFWMMQIEEPLWEELASTASRGKT